MLKSSQVSEKHQYVDEYTYNGIVQRLGCSTESNLLFQGEVWVKICRDSNRRSCSSGWLGLEQGQVCIDNFVIELLARLQERELLHCKRTGGQAICPPDGRVAKKLFAYIFRALLFSEENVVSVVQRIAEIFA
jgi:hypothetical protein